MNEPVLLVADDDSAILELLSLHGEDLGCKVVMASDGLQALEKAQTVQPDAIVLDMMMPNLSGMQILKAVKSDPDLENIPVILLTGSHERESILSAYSLGAHDFITKPVDIEIFRLRLQNALKVKRYEDYLKLAKTSLEELVQARTDDLQRTLAELEESHEHLEVNYRDTIRKLALLSEYRDTDTGDHILRIGEYSRFLAACCGTDSAFQSEIFLAAILHDIGKVGIPDEILLKKGPLDSGQWEHMKSHTEIGKDILLTSGDSGLFSTAAEIAWCHHERWNGGGYPQNLRGESIPLAARIVSVVDTYDALRAIRPYKAPIGHDDAMQIMLKGDGRTVPEHFDPDILSAFGKNQAQFDDIYQQSINERDSVSLGEKI